MEKPKKADRLAALGNSDFAHTLESATNYALGEIRDVGPRQKFPISGLTARQFACNRAMLVGEAGHVFPPIGAQGLNLGFRDGALAAELVDDALSEGLDPGNDFVLNEYDRRRRRDIMPRTIAIDLLNRSLTSNLVPFQGLRKLGIMALDKFGPLRRALMSRGIAPVQDLPRVMRPADTSTQAHAVGYR
jgi:2-octaprenyl-6-methoxyphenol hydroxylase